MSGDLTPSGRVFTVAFGVPFLDILAQGVLDGTLPPGGSDARSDPLTLSDTTILMPTRRASRALQETFLAQASGHALILPKIRPISDADEDAGLIAASPAADAALANPLPLALDGIERQLCLADLIIAWAGKHPEAAPLGMDQPARVLALAADLAGLIDLVETEGVPLTDIETLIPDHLSEHWQVTTTFLQLVIHGWPQALATLNRMAPADRRNRLIRAEADRIAADAAQAVPHPVIVAGVTGSIPASAELMRAVAAHPRGAIVLPGLDMGLDHMAFAAIRPRQDNGPAATDTPEHPEHPQFGLSGVLSSLGLSRGAIGVLGADRQSRPLALRAHLLSEAMRPASTTARWRDLARDITASDVGAALDQMSLIEAPSALDEAEIVALILREALETPGQTAALVTPDRLLARRVGVRLKAWGIDIDDSAGRPFRKTPPGTLLDLILTVFETDFAPGAVVQLVKHPLCRLGLAAGDVRRAARNLELAAFRTIYLGRGIAGIRASLSRTQDRLLEDRAPRTVRALTDADWAACTDLVGRLETAFAPLAAFDSPHAETALADMVEALVATAEGIAASPDNTSDEKPTASPDVSANGNTLWLGEAGTHAAHLLARLLSPDLRAPHVTPATFPDAYRALVAAETVRTLAPVHPRLTIWGPYEARLQSVDVVVLGGLNDRTWPELPETGPWLNRPMRGDLGLPQPEEDIGRAAHDFVQLCGMTRVLMTRAEKVDGVPTVPSRWLLRLKTVLASLGAQDALASDRPWLGWALNRTARAEHAPVSKPAPKPPVALRPKRLSVTDVERWIANPYALFAAKILELEALPAIGKPPDGALRGMIVHQALARFARAHPKALPENVAETLTAFAGEIFAEYAANPAVRAFWMPRFARFTDWFAATEADRRVGLAKSHAEVVGRLVLNETLTLTARADRIDERSDGIAIYDYKSTTASGLGPMGARAEALVQPQLPLEAAIARAVGFTGIKAHTVTQLTYISTAGSNPPGGARALKENPEVLAEDAIARLGTLVAAFQDPTTPYAAVRRAQFAHSYGFDVYAQLARIGEWRVDDAAEDAAA